MSLLALFRLEGEMRRQKGEVEDEGIESAGHRPFDAFIPFVHQQKGTGRLARSATHAVRRLLAGRTETARARLAATLAGRGHGAVAGLATTAVVTKMVLILITE